jgi:alpha-galactosidase/6-phospho-beta-glucosidase family protein
MNRTIISKGHNMTSRIVLIGAGSANFGLGTLGDILKSKALVGSTVILHDINPQALERVHKCCARLHCREAASIPG